MYALPIPASEALRTFSGALAARLRAIKHKSSLVEFHHFTGAQDPSGYECLEVLLGAPARNAMRFSLKVWEDRWCRFDARRSGKTGWTFEWWFDGRVAAPHLGEALIAALEHAHACAMAEPVDVVELDKIWSAILLRGPRG